MVFANIAALNKVINYTGWNNLKLIKRLGTHISSLFYLVYYDLTKSKKSSILNCKLEKRDFTSRQIYEGDFTAWQITKLTQMI